MSEDEFVKLKYVGGGSFGEVYKAKRKADKQICALKYISKLKSRKAVKDARNEIYLIERLRHVNIIQLLQHFETAQHIVLVCEYVSKELFRALKEEKKMHFSEDKVRQLTCQICSALYYIHSLKVLHRDLKPENILLTKQGTVKVCDFGFARFMGDSYYARTIQGTLLYMAPELFEASEYVHYTEKVDIWALGCIIYELFEGRALFNCKSLKEMAKMHNHIKLPNDMNDHMKHLIGKLLIHDHRKRIPWPYILKHPFFKGGIRVAEEDLERESPYTKPEIAVQKRHELNVKTRILRQYRRKPKSITEKTNIKDDAGLTTNHDNTKTPTSTIEDRITKTPTSAIEDRITKTPTSAIEERITKTATSAIEDGGYTTERRQVRSLYDNVDYVDAVEDSGFGVDSLDSDSGDWNDNDIACYWNRSLHDAGESLLAEGQHDVADEDLVDGAGDEDIVIVYVDDEADEYADSDDLEETAF